VKHLAGILCLAMLGLAGLSMATVATDDIFSDAESLLPPVQTWSGKSQALQAGPDDPWITPAEQTGLNSTPDYAETMAWLARLVAATAELEMVVIGKSLQGRDIQMVIASSDQAFSPAAMHGITVERLSEPLSVEAEIYRLPEAKIAEPSDWTPNPFEGHIRIDPGQPEKQTVDITFPAGSFRISTDQPMSDLIVLMLEPQSVDSFLQWGFFLEIFTRTEYAEAYLLEPLAQKMLAADDGLKARFEQRLASDKSFAASQYQRLMWFYQQTPFYDQTYLLYPVTRIP